MSVRRVMGIETEYGILQPGAPGANPMALSSQVVLAYRSLLERSPARARWDYNDEDPLADARGFHLARASAHPSLLTDDPSSPAAPGPTAGEPALEELARPPVEEYDDPSAANVILGNGARLYVDHAHPEYSSPEVTTPRDAVRWDVAGERVMLAASRALAGTHGHEVALYKNNVDGKGASYGTHENYLVRRDVDFATLVEVLTPFLVTRQVFTGSGRVGLGATGQEAGFQISQRADYIEAEVGLETTLRRPIVNTRDEPHADRTRWRRLHVILGDANAFEVATYLKLGATSLVLWLIESLDRLDDGVREELASLRLADPVGDVHRVSRDLGLSAALRLADGGSATALAVQRRYLDAVAEAARRLGADDPDTVEAIGRWRSVLDRLGEDPLTCAREVEWVAKLRLLEGLRRREGLDWGHPRLAAMDLQWSDVRLERGIYHRLVSRGAAERLVDEESVLQAVVRPPEDTRAYFRGRAMSDYGDSVAAASWDSVIFDVEGADSLQRVPMMDPLRGTRAHVAELFDRSPDARTLLEGLAQA